MRQRQRAASLLGALASAEYLEFSEPSKRRWYPKRLVPCRRHRSDEPPPRSCDIVGSGFGFRPWRGSVSGRAGAEQRGVTTEALARPACSAHKRTLWAIAGSPPLRPSGLRITSDPRTKKRHHGFSRSSRLQAGTSISDADAQFTLILRGFAFSALGSTRVMTPSLSSALIPSCSILLESRKLRA